MAVKHIHPAFSDTPDNDTDPDLFTKPGQVTTRYCSICGRGYDMFTLPELQRWLKLTMDDQQAANVALAFRLWADRL